MFYVRSPGVTIAPRSIRVIGVVCLGRHSCPRNTGRQGEQAPPRGQEGPKDRDQQVVATRAIGPWHATCAFKTPKGVIVEIGDVARRQETHILDVKTKTGCSFHTVSGITGAREKNRSMEKGAHVWFSVLAYVGEDSLVVFLGKEILFHQGKLTDPSVAGLEYMYIQMVDTKFDERV